jgi:tRNA (guanosine-2'-O-)-methyltransferase
MDRIESPANVDATPGILMTPERFARLRRVLARRQPDLTVLMERVNKSHNFSAILRSCDAVGALEAHVVLPGREVDLHHGTAAGAAKWVEVHTHDDVATAVGSLQRRGFRVLAAHPEGEARDYRVLDLTRPTAFMLGAELDGISEEGLSLADGRVVIPMAGMVHSLNVSVATALLLFEAKRQRDEVGLYERPRLAADDFRRRLFEWAYPDLAARCREAGAPYPALDDRGELLERPQV